MPVTRNRFVCVCVTVSVVAVTVYVFDGIACVGGLGVQLQR